MLVKVLEASINASLFHPFLYYIISKILSLFYMSLSCCHNATYKQFMLFFGDNLELLYDQVENLCWNAKLSQWQEIYSQYRIMYLADDTLHPDRDVLNCKKKEARASEASCYLLHSKEEQVSGSCNAGNETVPAFANSHRLCLL